MGTEISLVEAIKVELTVRIMAYTHPLKGEEMVECFVPEGMTIAEILGDIDPEKTAVWHNGNYIEDEWYPYVRPKAGTSVVIRAVPQKDILRIGLQIGIVIAATYATGGAYFAAHAFAHALVFGAVTLAGQALANAL